MNPPRLRLQGVVIGVTPYGPHERFSSTRPGERSRQIAWSRDGPAYGGECSWACAQALSYCATAFGLVAGLPGFPAYFFATLALNGEPVPPLDLNPLPRELDMVDGPQLAKTFEPVCPGISVNVWRSSANAIPARGSSMQTVVVRGPRDVSSSDSFAKHDAHQGTARGPAGTWNTSPRSSIRRTSRVFPVRLSPQTHTSRAAERRLQCRLIPRLTDQDR
jgi:hypothetical protein